MINETIDDKELAFLEQLRKHENKWVAIFESDDGEAVVGSGADAVEATREAESKGYQDACSPFNEASGAGRNSSG